MNDDEVHLTEAWIAFDSGVPSLPMDKNAFAIGWGSVSQDRYWPTLSGGRNILRFVKMEGKDSAFMVYLDRKCNVDLADNTSLELHNLLLTPKIFRTRRDVRELFQALGMTP